MNYLLKPFLTVMLVFTLLATLAFAQAREPHSSIEKHHNAKNIGWGQSPTGYDLSNPDRVYELEDALREISGLTDIDGRTIAAIQDEDGTVFFYNLFRKEVIRKLDFAGPGDYEGITRVDNDLYVLRSGGTLYEIIDFRADKPEVNEYDLDLPVKESEGLGLDAANNRLLIAAKSKAKGDAYEDKKVVYGFDLQRKERSERPLLAFSEATIDRVLRARTGDRYDEDFEVSINPSAIAVHPRTGELFVPSSKDNLLYVFRSDEDIVGIYELPKKQFPQPEGLTFMSDGDMLISNEGKKGRPTLMHFAYQTTE